MNNDTFQWTDQKAKEFAQFCQGRVIVFVEEELEKFKQSKIKKEWEVLKLQNKHGGTVYKEEKYSWEDIGVRSFDEYKIIRVKRISDNEIFTVGDMIDNHSPSPIKYFSITNDRGEMWVNGPGFGMNINDLKKLPPKKERIEVTLGGIHEDIGGTKYAICFSRHIGREKFPAIKSSVERVLNDDGIKCREDVPDEEKMYSRDYFLKEVEKAFNAGKEIIPAGYKHHSFQDYINHQRDKK